VKNILNLCTGFTLGIASPVFAHSTPMPSQIHVTLHLGIAAMVLVGLSLVTVVMYKGLKRFRD